MGRSRWDPWADVEDETLARVAWRELEGADGVVDGGLPPTITLDPRLGRRACTFVLGHEVIHVQLEFLFAPDTPPALVEKQEAIVRRRTVDRFIPPDELAAFVHSRMSEGPVSAGDVAVEFDTTTEAALDAMRRLAHTSAMRGIA